MAVNNLNGGIRLIPGDGKKSVKIKYNVLFSFADGANIK
ncbi:hypothetical protein DDI_1328 [Dickeya dianthicola RNS04.9]|nr:hypothetical protein DDI_1328 [Dickeya dianthicola RNS04.9]